MSSTSGRREARWVARLLELVRGRLEMPCSARLWDGTMVELASGAPRFTVTFRSRRALGRLIRQPTALGFGEAFIDGDVDLEGDLFEAARAALRLDAPLGGLRARLAMLVARLGAATRRRTRAQVAFHYDVSNAFYALFLDPRMVYTCAYYRQPDADLATAQEDKLDLVCRKLRLRPGERLLDLGCGWGALVAWAAERWGAEARGVTLSAAQAEWAAQAIRRAGLAGCAGVECRDWRDVPVEPRYDKIAAVGLIEHVGRRHYAELFAHVRQLLAPGGLFLNHGITTRPGAGWSSAMEFLTRHVFPGGELADLATTVRELERAGFEVLDVEDLRGHYARTTRQWAERLAANADRARTLVGERIYRTYLAYLTAASVAFEEGWIALHQVVSARREDAAALTTREAIYADRPTDRRMRAS